MRKDSIREVEIGGDYDATVLEPATAIFTFVLAVLTIVLPRKRALLPFMLVVSTIPLVQRVVIGGLDFSMIRLIIMVAWVRILMNNEHRGFKMNEVDKAFLIWNVVGAIFYFLQKLSVGALVFKAGRSIDIVGAYFMVRVILNNPRQLEQIFKDYAWIAGIVGIMMFLELRFGDNLFHIFGSRPHVYVSSNDGRVRAMGPFSHVIMGGSYHAHVVPLLVGLYLATRKNLPLVLFGLMGCTLGVFGANSSGALVAWAGGIGAMCMWVVRHHINLIWKVAFGLGILLHFAMEKPIWHLLVRAAQVTGGGGYHRYLLIDACMNRVTEWALRGTKSTAHWGWGLQDITNQWVLEAVNGGMATLIAFNCVLVFAFRAIGLSARAAKRRKGVPRRRIDYTMAIGWGLGASLFAHCMAFLSVSYFGQLTAVFSMSIAMISAHYEVSRRRAPRRRKRSASAEVDHAGEGERDRRKRRVPEPEPAGARRASLSSTIRGG